RISFTAILLSGHTLVRRQCPLAPGYSTIFNSCQGILHCHARIIFHPGERTTTNVTYQEILV
ncbi:hypothetical protein DFH08DRAFT_721475, partial [Mycena albidolilacea]